MLNKTTRILVFIFAGMMPGLGFIGGHLSVIGGYSWPGGVALIEQWDEDQEEWVKVDHRLKYPR